MIIALSPYHLTTREPAALAALLLAKRAITVVPPPLDLGGADPIAAGRRVPAFSEFIRSWQWSQPFWKSGVLHAAHAHQTAIDDLLHVCEHIRMSSELLPLRHFVKDEESFIDREQYLHAVATDLLKAGPDPGISLPVCAGLDRFSTRLGLVVARSRPQSLAQQAEARMGRGLFTIAVPGFLQASAQRILHAREVLAQELADLASAIAPIPQRLADPRESIAQDDAGLTSSSSPIGSDDMSEIHNAAAALAHAWEEKRDELLMGAIDDDVRVIEGTITIAAAQLPWDVALTSSIRALGVLAPKILATNPVVAARLQPTAESSLAADNPSATAISRRDPMQGRTLLSLLVKPMGQSKK